MTMPATNLLTVFRVKRRNRVSRSILWPWTAVGTMGVAEKNSMSSAVVIPKGRWSKSARRKAARLTWQLKTPAHFSHPAPQPKPVGQVTASMPDFPFHVVVSYH